MSKPTLKSLLAWAKRNRHFIEIYCDGSAQVQLDSDITLEGSVIDGDTLYDALLKAKAAERKK